MRYKKTVTENNSVTAVYDYVYSDGKLILLTHNANGTANTARFIYDSFGEPRGFILNNTASYLYLKNGQGDITAIVDENGAVLLTYTYTAWGEITYSATSMQSMLLAATLSNVNPFTYRGYCYDYDIGMYYLQSRYYDPVICRFINADSTDYLGATGTLLSYNLFAYCENDGVNCVDATGTWAKDVHLGYFIEPPKGVTYKYVGGIYKYSNVNGVYMAYVTRFNKITQKNENIYYGTYLWAIQCGIIPDYARIIADACNEVDDLDKGLSWMPYIGDQSWHFNTNWGTNKTDSRIINSNSQINYAHYFFSIGKTIEGLRALGKSLHPIQDIFAHTRDKCHSVSACISVGNKLYRIGIYSGVIWFHFQDGVIDNAKIRYTQMMYAGTKTKQILTTFVNKYPYLKHKGKFI